MGIAPLVGVAVSAAGTVAGLNQQSRAARAQRQGIANQELIARDNLTIKTQQLEQAKVTSEQRFIAERGLLDAQTGQARVQLEQQKELASLQDLQRTVEITALEQQAEQQAAQLLTAASAGETQASVSNTDQLFQLAQRFLGSEDQANAFIANLASTSVGGQLTQTAEALLQNATLENTAEAQGVARDTGTRTRIAGIEGDLQRGQSDLIQRQGVLSTDYLKTVQDIQNRANDITFKQSSSDIANVSAQNLAGLEAAKFASQAELQTMQGVANQEFRSQQAALNAQRGSIQSPNVIGAIAGLGAQAFGAFSRPSLLGSSTPSQSIFGSSNLPTISSASSPAFNSSNLQFGAQFNTGLR